MLLMKRVVLCFATALLAVACYGQSGTVPQTMPQTAPQPGAAGGPQPLKLTQAEEIALKNHPLIAAAQNEVLTADEHIIENKAAYYPVLDGDLTGSQASQNARLGAGSFAMPYLFNHFGAGVTFSQLITDSGRTPNLVANSKLMEQATQQDVLTNKYDVLLAVDRAYFEVLRAQALVKVAEETVAARQLLLDQITALANNKLRSEVDVSFADVDVSEAKLLLIRAQNQLDSQRAELDRSLGIDKNTVFALVDEPMPPTPPNTVDSLIDTAVKNRPELASLRLSGDAARKFERAERDLSYPTVSLIGAAGFLPLFGHDGPIRMPSDYYEGAAVNVDIPIFNGHLFTARREAARYQTIVADQKLRNEMERITRDVRVAWSGSVTSFQRIDVTTHLVAEASLSLQLAQGRYNLGLGTIVELTQAQLNLTQAEIENLNAKYDYHSQFAVLQYTQGLLR